MNLPDTRVAPYKAKAKKNLHTTFAKQSNSCATGGWSSRCWCRTMVVAAGATSPHMKKVIIIPRPASIIATEERTQMKVIGTYITFSQARFFASVSDSTSRPTDSTRDF